MGEIVQTLVHNGRSWKVVRIEDSYYARDHNENDTGPFSAIIDAADWIRAIRP